MKTKSTFFVGATGSFEEVTVKKWKRFRVLSHKSIGNLTNIAPRILGQRLAMFKLGELAVNAGTVISRGLAEYRLRRSWWPMFMSLNLGPAFDFTDPEAPVFIPANLTVARGKLGTTAFTITASAFAGGAIDWIWDGDASGYQSENDQFCFIVYNRRNGLYYRSVGDGIRSSENLESSSPPIDIQLADILDTWTFFIQPSGSGAVKSGNSFYAEVTATA